MNERGSSVFDTACMHEIVEFIVLIVLTHFHGRRKKNLFYRVTDVAINGTAYIAVPVSEAGTGFLNAPAPGA